MGHQSLNFWIGRPYEGLFGMIDWTGIRGERIENSQPAGPDGKPPHRSLRSPVRAHFSVSDRPELGVDFWLLALLYLLAGVGHLHRSRRLKASATLSP
jgi:hypothetical protein